MDRCCDWLAKTLADPLSSGFGAIWLPWLYRVRSTIQTSLKEPSLQLQSIHPLFLMKFQHQNSFQILSQQQNKFGGGTPKAPKPGKAPQVTSSPAPVYVPPAPVATKKVAESNADTRGDEEEAAKRRGTSTTDVNRQSTILTGGQGDVSAAPTQKKTLLGG